MSVLPESSAEERLAWLVADLEDEATPTRNMTHDEIVVQCAAGEILRRYRREFPT